MSFLEEFDRRAGGEEVPEGENKELLDFADLVRSRRAVPNEEERQRVLARVRAAGARPRRGLPWYLLRTVAAAAVVLLCVGVVVATRTPRSGGRSDPDDGHITKGDPIQIDVKAPGKAEDPFAKIDFPTVKPHGVTKDKSVEKPGAARRARVLRSGGLVMLRRKGEERWRVAGRGTELRVGDTLRTSRRLNSGARLLGPEGSRVALAWGGELRFEGPRAWHLAGGRAFFDVAKRPDLGEFRVSTPDGSARALGTEFLLSVQTKGEKRATFCWVDEGKVALAGGKGQKLVLAAGKSGRLTSGAVVPAKAAGDVDWLKILEGRVDTDHGIGELLARAVDGKSAPMQPLEIKSHKVSVTVVDQVARTFLDEVFVNNTYRRMEGVFYYTLPPDAAVSEFAMYVNGKRVEGEVIEQKRARQIFEYIVRQRRDPALLEWAGGNLFKMRIFPIEPRSTKRIQLGYTQVLARRDGKVTYSYPLVSEKLLKNPLHDLSIDFRVLSSFGLRKLTSPSHRVARALDKDGLRGALAFRATDYSPTRDFSVTYEVPDAPECAVFGNRPKGKGDNYFMLQLCPRAKLPSRSAPQRILVIVDGSASSGAQDYAVAGEFASSVADMTSGWQFGVLRGGQKPELFGKGLVAAGPGLSVKVREFLSSRPPLGATDLLATFGAAAKVIKPGERVQIVYVGDGVETLGEVEGSALADRIAGLFEGLDVEISCAAVGSSYDRQVLSRLAGATGGVFVRVEGAAGVHAAVGQILDSFYQPLIRGVRVRVEGLKADDIYPDAPVTVADGDTLVVLGRAGRTGRGKVIVTGQTAGGAFRKTYDVKLEADPENNRFLPRLWAKAHIDSLFAQMGLAGASEDSRLRLRIIDTSVHYQIMSPFTAFLVLEGEDHFKKFKIKRRKKMWDWHGDAEGISSTARGGQVVPGGGTTGGEGLKKKWPPDFPGPSMDPSDNPRDPKPSKRPRPTMTPMPEPPMKGAFTKSGSFRDRWRIDEKYQSWDGREEERKLERYKSDGGFDYDPRARKDMEWREWDAKGRLGDKLRYKDYGIKRLMRSIEDATVPHSRTLVYPDGWERATTRVPILGEVPILGMLFAGRRRVAEELANAEYVLDTMRGKGYSLPAVTGGTPAQRLAQAEYVIATMIKKGFSVHKMVGTSALGLIPDVRTKVVDIRPSTGHVALGAGKRSGIKEGFIFLIHRGDRYVGKVRVTTVWDNFSGGTIVERKAPIKAGDDAMTDTTPGASRPEPAPVVRAPRPVYRRPGRISRYVSPLLTDRKVVGLRIDRPLRSSAVYKRVIAIGKAKLADRLNLSLALEAEGKFAEAARALKPVIARMPEVPDLWLELGSLHLRSRDKKASDAAFKKALKLTPEKDRPALRARIGQILAAFVDYVSAAEFYRAAALAARQPAGGAGWAATAADCYRNAGRAGQARKLWTALGAKWPRNGGVLAAAARWHLASGDGPAEAAKLFGLARGRGEACGHEMVRALRRAGQGQEAVIEARAILKVSTSPREVSAVLGTLAESHTKFARREAVRLLGPRAGSAQRAGVAQAMHAYPTMRAGETLDALAAALRGGFPDGGRLAAFGALVSAGRRTITIRAGKSGPISEMLTPLLVDPGDPLKLSRAIGAAQVLGGSGFHREALSAAEGLLARRKLSARQRLGLQQILFVALEKLGRKEEAARRMAAAFDAAEGPAAAVHFGWQVFGRRMAAKEFEGAAGVVERIARKLAGGEYDAYASGRLARMRAELFRGFKRGMKPAEADKLVIRLAAKYPEDVAYLSSRAKILAGDGKYPDAAEFLRKSIRRLAGAPARIAKRPDLARDRAAGRASLISLLGRVSAQDAELRVAFLAEAAARRGKEDAILRPWTEAALSCLLAAADEGAHLKMLAGLAASEPAEPGWSRRLAAAYYRNGKLKEARKVCERLLESSPADAALALRLHSLCVRLKDAGAAKRYRDLALDALELRPDLLQQYASQWQRRADRREWALEAWKRLAKRGPHARSGYAAYMAGSTAQYLGRNKAAMGFYFRVLEAEGGAHAQSAIDNLTNLWNQNRGRIEFKARLKKALVAWKGGPGRAYLHVLQSQTEAAGNAREGRTILKKAAEVKLSDDNCAAPAGVLIRAFIRRGWHDEAERYARRSAGKLGAASRRQLLRAAATWFYNCGQRSRARGIYRELLRRPDAHEDHDRAQLVNVLVADNDLSGAERELRKITGRSGSQTLYNAWSQVITGYRSRGKHRQAARVAIDALDRYSGDSAFYAQCGYTCIYALNDAVVRAGLDAATRERIKKAVLSATEKHFENASAISARYGRWYDYWYTYGHNCIDKLGLRAKIDELARKAGESSEAGRVLHAARYFHTRGKSKEATKLYARALGLPGADRRSILPHLYNLCYAYGSKEQKGEALKYLEELLELGVYRQPTYLSQRIYLLYQLGRKKEARKACRGLLDDPRALRYGHAWLGTVAGYCQNYSDWATAAEVWELAIRALRAYNRAYRGGANYHALTNYYTYAARCYTQDKRNEEALACYLRGLSVIPRDYCTSCYKTFRSAALKQFLKGRVLDEAVAGYEKAVKKSGGQEKPQLRVAFAEAYRQAGKTRQMLHNLQIAADLLPKDMKLRQQVITGYKRLGDKEAVIKAYLSWAKMDRQNIEIYRALGDYYKSLGRDEEAMLAWATMAEVRPRESEGYRAYAKKLVSHGRHKKAAVGLRKAIRYRPTRHDIANELASVYRRLKQEEKIAKLWTDGEKACRQAMKDFADDPLPWLNLVRFLKAQKKTTEARKMCNRILKRRWPRFQGETHSEARRLMSSLGKS